MNKKDEIIINNVDVSGCTYFNKFRNICNNTNLSRPDCTVNENCYYKQLQRLQQENKMLIEDIKSYQNWYDEQVQINDSLQKVYQSEHIDNLKYKKVLEEIREIADLINKGIICGHCNSAKEAEKILNKIREV